MTSHFAARMFRGRGSRLGELRLGIRRIFCYGFRRFLVGQEREVVVVAAPPPSYSRRRRCRRRRRQRRQSPAVVSPARRAVPATPGASPATTCRNAAHHGRVRRAADPGHRGRVFFTRCLWQAAGCPRHNVPRARDTRVPHPLPTCASSDSLAAVRCCGPQQCTSVCRRDAEETCALTSIDSRLTSFAEAGAECAAQGRRLCTRRELEDGKCCRAGCNMDGVLVWSSDECASITAARPPLAAPASTSTPTALPCAIATPRGFGPCCDRGSLRAKAQTTRC